MYCATFATFAFSYLSLFSITIYLVLVAGDDLSIRLLSHLLSKDSVDDTLESRYFGRFLRRRNYDFGKKFSLISDSIKPSNVVTKTLTIANQMVAPDRFSKLLTTVNGQYPGPLLSANKGDQLMVNVVNELKDGSLDLLASLHWHGLMQEDNSWEDGTSGVTQCPIIPGESFEYTFKTQQTGTYLYHSHQGLQYCDGLRGPLVIYDPNDPLRRMYDFDDADFGILSASTIITLADWYHVPAAAVPGPPAETGAVTVINGLGRNPTDLTAPLAVINMQYGKL